MRDVNLNFAGLFIRQSLIKPAAKQRHPCIAVHRSSVSKHFWQDWPPNTVHIKHPELDVDFDRSPKLFLIRALYLTRRETNTSGSL